MKISKILSITLLILMVGLASCKVKDADVQSAVTEKLKSNPELASLSVTVSEGIATLEGQVKDEATKTLAEETVKSVKGVKSVVNNTSLPLPPPVIEVPKVDPLLQGVNDAIKDLPTVHSEVQDSVIILTGEIKKKELTKLMQMLHSLKPKKIENKLTVK